MMHETGFESGLLNYDHMENADETHFIFKMDEGKTVRFCGDVDINYCDVVSGEDPITIMVRLSGGRGEMIQPPTHIFKNSNFIYPIRRVTDDVPGM